MTSGEEQASGLEIPVSLIRAVHSTSPASGATHSFYKYPARFSPEFVRAAIENFTEPGEVVLDPFMGSGTTLVEAMLLGRHAIGSDINPLAHFLATVKTTFLSEADYQAIRDWLGDIQPQLNLRRPARRAHEWADAGYQKDLPWPIRKTIEFILAEVKHLPRAELRRFARCALLKASQQALDCTSRFPSAAEFRNLFNMTVEDFIQDMVCTRNAIPTHARPTIVCLNVAASDLDNKYWQKRLNKKVNLIVTSPPYPGVHVLYHRWQIKGRRETAAPYWIIDRLDGAGGSYYTMGSRTPTGIDFYFESITESFEGIRSLLSDDALVLQLVAFSEIRTQLPRFLQAMRAAGYREVDVEFHDQKRSERVSRRVPLRKWYASLQGKTSSSREFLFIHTKTS